MHMLFCTANPLEGAHIQLCTCGAVRCSRCAIVSLLSPLPLNPQDFNLEEKLQPSKAADDDDGCAWGA